MNHTAGVHTAGAHSSLIKLHKHLHDQASIESQTLNAINVKMGYIYFKTEVCTVGSYYLA